MAENKAEVASLWNLAHSVVIARCCSNCLIKSNWRLLADAIDAMEKYLDSHPIPATAHEPGRE